MTEWRKDINRWGYRFYHQNKCYKRYGWATRTEAKQAEAEARTDLQKHGAAPKTALVSVAAWFLIDRAEQQKSEEWISNMRYTLERIILPYFGEQKNIATIGPLNIEAWVKTLKARGLRDKTIWNYVIVLRAVFNFALKHDLLRDSPVRKADLSMLKDRTPRLAEQPLDLSAVEKAASVLTDPLERAYFYTLALTGCRKSEANRAQWTDVDWLNRRIWVRGSKTQKSKGWLPLAPALQAVLLELHGQKTESELIFPGRTARTKGKQVTDRKKLFLKIAKLTQQRYGEAVRIPRQTQYMRRWFGTRVAAATSDPNTISKLMRHTNLGTTSGYMMTVNEYAHAAVSALDVMSNAAPAAIEVELPSVEMTGRIHGAVLTPPKAVLGPETLPATPHVESEKSELST